MFGFARNASMPDASSSRSWNVEFRLLPHTSDSFGETKFIVMYSVFICYFWYYKMDARALAGATEALTDLCCNWENAGPHQHRAAASERTHKMSFRQDLCDWRREPKTIRTRRKSHTARPESIWCDVLLSRCFSRWECVRWMPRPNVGVNTTSFHGKGNSLLVSVYWFVIY